MAATEFDHQGVENFFSLKTLSLCEGSSLKISQEIHINRDMSNIDFREVWVQNPKIQKEAHSFLSKKCGLGFPLYT